MPGMFFERGFADAGAYWIRHFVDPTAVCRGLAWACGKLNQQKSKRKPRKPRAIISGWQAFQFPSRPIALKTFAP